MKIFARIAFITLFTAITLIACNEKTDTARVRPSTDSHIVIRQSLLDSFHVSALERDRRRDMQTAD